MSPVAASFADPTPWYELHGLEPGLLLAPPGCGKTESLARWTASVVGRQLLGPSQRILCLTFSTKATANLRSRVRRHLGAGWHRHAHVTNFHGLAFRVYQHHASAIGLEPLAERPQTGWLNALTTRVTRATGVDRTELGAALRYAKVGPYTSAEVVQRLESLGFAPALDYEYELRAAGKVDHDDTLRLGHLALAELPVRDLYRCAFGAVVVDELQDLSLGHLILARQVGLGRTLYAGDPTQGIYGFAGAQPELVLAAIREEDPVEHHLRVSYRSSPAVLRVVGAIATELGGTPMDSAIPDAWLGRGTARLLTPSTVDDEATIVLEIVTEWIRDHPDDSVAVIARTGPRRRWVDAEVRARGLDAEVWDFPMHSALITALLTRHVDTATEVASAPDHPLSATQELYNRCFIELDPAELGPLDELQDACDAIEQLEIEGHQVRDVVAGIRITSSPDEPVGPGLHLLNGHVGKGQQFNRVIVIGLEESLLPMYPAMKAEQRGDPSQIRDELAVLHVMVSRAQEDLILVTTASVPNARGEDQRRERSRFLGLVAHLLE